jgi:putative membrane protein (TIGR04086 family)
MKPRKRNTKDRASKTAKKDRFPQKSAKAFLITLTVGAGTLLLFSLGAYFFPDPDPLIRPLALLAAAITSFVGGIVSGKIHGHAPFVCGATNGLLLLALMILLSLPFHSLAVGYTAWLSLLLHTAVLLLSIGGAVVGTQKRAPRRRRRTR